MTTATADIKHQTRNMTPDERARFIMRARTVDGRRIFDTPRFTDGGIAVKSYSGETYLVSGDQCSCPATRRCWHIAARDIIASRYEHAEPCPWVAA